MFLVKRVLVAGREQILLSPALRDGQSIYLNLAASQAPATPAIEEPPISEASRGGAPVGQQHQQLSDEAAATFGVQALRHLQLVCLVEGGSHEPDIDWTLGEARGDGSHSGNSSSSGNDNSDNINLDVDSAGELVRGWGRADTSQQTEQLIKATLWNPQLAALEAAGKEQCPSYTKHWSSFKLHNISVRQHQTSIKCQVGHPTKRSLGGSDQAADSNESRGPVRLFTEPELSTSVRLNITHVPVLDLKVESFPEPLVVDDRKSQKQVDDGFRAIAYGQNVSLTCKVAFANPPLLRQIEWSLNDADLSMYETPAADGKWRVPALMQVQVMRKLASTTTTFQQAPSTERLIVQFHDLANISGKPPSSEETGIRQVQLQLKCKAHNSLGEGSSQPVSLLLSHPPVCLFNGLPPEPHRGDKKDSPLHPVEAAASVGGGSDKDLAIHCPVISDKNSSTFHWLLPVAAGQPVIIDTGHVNPVPVSRVMQALGGGIAGVRDIQLGMLQSIQCHASDKFGSNQATGCRTQLVNTLEWPTDTRNRKQQSAIDKGDKTIQGQNCTAKLVHNEVNKLETSRAMNLTGGADLDTVQFLPVKPKLTALIECQIDYQDYSGSSEWQLVFDLYKKWPRQRLERFISPSKEPTSSWWLELNLGNEGNTTVLPTPQTLADSYFLALSLVEKDDVIKDVTTIPFLVGSSLSQQELPASQSGKLLLLVAQQNGSVSNFKLDHHYSISESGRRQPTDWVIKGLLGVALASSVVLVIAGWICSRSSAGSKCDPGSTTINKGQEGSKSQPDLNDNPTATEWKQTTEMYLVDGEQESNVYHNQVKVDHHGFEREQSNRLQWQQPITLSMTALGELPTSGATGTSQVSYEHVIVINHPPGGSSTSPCSISTAHLVDSQDTSSPALSCLHHWQSPADTFFLLEPEPELISELSNSNQLAQGASSHQLESSTLQLRPFTGTMLRPFRKEIFGDKSNMNGIELDELDSSLMYPALGTTRELVATSLLAGSRLQPENGSPNNNNKNHLELNSQGELTMTDESSSFVHEDSGYNQISSNCNQLNQKQHHHHHHVYLPSTTEMYSDLIRLG